MTNPLTLLPPKVRLVVYAVLTLAAIALAAYQAADGDWLVAASYVLGALGFGTATSNTPARHGDRGAFDYGTAVLIAFVAVVIVFLAWVLR